MMVEYDVIDVEYLSELIEKVNIRLHEGWHLVGGIAIRQEQWLDRDKDLMTTTYYVQALMKEH